MTAALLINIDVPDVDAAIDFYARAFGLALVRRLFGGAVAEMSLGGQLFHLLPKDEARPPFAGGPTRSYARHWTPLHLDLVVPNLDVALEHATEAGARVEREPQTHAWGRIAGLADPYGHGWCLIQLSKDGYDAVAS